MTDIRREYSENRLHDENLADYMARACPERVPALATPASQEVEELAKMHDEMADTTWWPPNVEFHKRTAAALRSLSRRDQERDKAVEAIRAALDKALADADRVQDDEMVNGLALAISIFGAAFPVAPLTGERG